MRISTTGSYWERDEEIEVWANWLPRAETTAGGVTVGGLRLQHSDPVELRRLADALSDAAGQLEALQAARQDVA